MSKKARVRVYMGCSLDGYIAGPNDDLSFLEAYAPGDGPSGALQFDAFLAQIGAMVMGRRTHDVVAGFGQWPYGDMPVLVPTHRPLTPAAAQVKATSGDIKAIIEEARQLAGDQDVYLDGGDLIRQGLNAGLVDELCITYVPLVLGAGTRLFEGVDQTRLRFLEAHQMGPMLQVSAVMAGSEN